MHEVFVDTGDGQPLHVWCGAFNMQAGDVVPLATIGTTMPERPADRPPQDPGRRQRGHAVLGRGARSRRRPLRHPDPAARDRARGAGRAGPRRQCRRRLRPRRHPQPARRLRPPRCGPGRGRSPGGAVPPADAGAGGRRAGAVGAGGDRRARPLRPLRLGRPLGPPRRSVRALDGRAADPGRDAADQQRRRRVELRDARAERAEPRVRPGHVGRRRLPHPPRRRRRDDGDARRRRAHVHGRRPAHRRRQRPPDRHRRA